MADGILRAWAHVKNCSACLTLREGTDVVAIAETVEQAWPRCDGCDGERPSEAHHWVAEGFADAEVVAWLEAGVPWATSAAQLRGAGLGPRDVGREHDSGTLGLAFARDEVSLAAVLRLVVGARVEEVHGA